MTNADKIRAMNDVDLAAWVREVLNEGDNMFGKWMCDRCLAEHGGECPHPIDEGCDKCGQEILLWLQEEAGN